MKIIEFKTVSPLFEQERDGVKNFTIRKKDRKDKRFRALHQWRCEYDWYIKIKNPETGKDFSRRIKNVAYLCWFDTSGERDPQVYMQEDWIAIEWNPIEEAQDES